MAFADAQSGAIIYHGEAPASVRLAGTVKAGDALGYNQGWVRALATTGSVVQMRCVASEDGVSGNEITAYFGPTMVGSRYSGATVWGEIYVAEGSDNGKVTQTAPTTTGDADKKVGVMISETIAVFNPPQEDDSVA